MPHYTEYKCSDCGAVFSQSEAHAGALVRKIAQFQTLGKNPRTVKSRTLKFVCTARCINNDPEYNLEGFQSPGQLSQGLERVRVAEIMLE